MTENEIMMGFYSFLISNAIFQVGGLFLLWVGFRATLRIYDEGAPMLNKILVTLFALGIVFINLQTIGFLDITCLLYTSPSPRDLSTSRMPSSA